MCLNRIWKIVEIRLARKHSGRRPRRHVCPCLESCARPRSVVRGGRTVCVWKRGEAGERSCVEMPLSKALTLTPAMNAGFFCCSKKKGRSLCKRLSREIFAEFFAGIDVWTGPDGNKLTTCGPGGERHSERSREAAFR